MKKEIKWQELEEDSIPVHSLYDQMDEYTTMLGSRQWWN